MSENCNCGHSNGQERKTLTSSLSGLMAANSKMEKLVILSEIMVQKLQREANPVEEPGCRNRTEKEPDKLIGFIGLFDAINTSWLKNMDRIAENIDKVCKMIE